MKKKLIISLIIVSILLCGISVYAYFIKEIKGPDHGLSSSPDDSQVVEVGDFITFAKETYLYDKNNHLQANHLF